MNAITIILGIWAILALVAILFIRGATARVKRSVKEVSQSKGPSRFSLVE